ncbi:MAG: alginate lyase family protein [Clostridia bacterium]|nr:alginate lyase family protein [Clostridia bacterium]
MSKLRMLRSVFREYGLGWAFYRTLYSAKLKLLAALPACEGLFEKKTPFPKRLDLFTVDTAALRRFLQALPEEDKNALIREADGLCEGRIVGFSSLLLDYGNPIDWQKNPLTGERCSEKTKWYRIPDFNEKRGDIKVTWEASRFSHFLTLARAFLLTGEKKYYEAFSRQLEDWLKNNPYGFGANFKCGQECSFRMINALLAYAVFRESGIASPKDKENLLELVDRCYRKILSNFFYAYRCIKNNHTVSELAGMIAGAWCTEDPKHLRKAYKMLAATVDRQFTEDGGYRQFSFNYQRLALQDLECVLSMGEKTGGVLPERCLQKIRNAALLMYQCQDESGDMPNYGSNDGALVFPVTSCGYRDFRPTVNAVHALAAGWRLYGSGKHEEELLWFSGGKPIERFPVRAVARRTSAFPSAGLFTLRGENAWAMIVLNDYRSRPAHMDQLHFDLWIRGVNVLCDGGTYSYASETGKRLIRNESHNTAIVADRPQMNQKGPFLLYDWTKRETVFFGEDRFEGALLSRNGYRHQRSVRLSGSGVEIADTADRDFEIAFHTPCKVVKSERGFQLSAGGETLCRIETESGGSVSAETRSLYYLREDPATSIRIKGSAGHTVTTKIKIF